MLFWTKIVVVVLIFMTVNSGGQSITQTHPPQNGSKSRMKTILYYTPRFGREGYGFGSGSEPFVKKCSGIERLNCFATSNRDHFGDIGDFDALIFHPINMLNNKSELEVPYLPGRKAHQRFVMYMKEAPLNPKHFFYGAHSIRRVDYYYDKLKGFFNWTMTHRLDSDIPVPHGWFEAHGEKRRSPLRHPIQWKQFDMEEFREHLYSKRAHYAKKLQLKRGLVTWLVSHCWTNSNREALVTQLQKFLPVTIFGRCTRRSCDNECYSHFSREFKFYLAIENNLCRHYVTEKIWSRIRQSFMIPIVAGNCSFHYKEFLPPHSYIQVEDFPIIKDLADYILHLDKNDEEYLSYFWWRQHYIIPSTRFSITLGMCELCRMLQDESQPRKVIQDVEDWWWTQSKCRPFPNWL